MKPVFLIGYMGCGKTTLGRALAEVADVRFVDLDDCIEAVCGASVTEIFACHGEEYFRKVERDVLHDVAGWNNVVIACGGGTPCYYDNMEFMNASGLTVWLDVSMARLLPRLRMGKAKRPIIADKPDEELEQFVIDALSRRRSFYAGAKSVFCSDLLENQTEIDSTVAEFITRYALPLKADRRI